MLKWASLVAQSINNLHAMWETWVRSLGWEDPLEKGTAIHSSILAQRISWTIQSTGSQNQTRLSNFHYSPYMLNNTIVLELYFFFKLEFNCFKVSHQFLLFRVNQLYVYINIPFLLDLPPTPIPSIQVITEHQVRSLFLPCKWVHLYHLS